MTTDDTNGSTGTRLAYSRCRLALNVHQMVPFQSVEV